MHNTKYFHTAVYYWCKKQFKNKKVSYINWKIIFLALLSDFPMKQNKRTHPKAVKRKDHVSLKNSFKELNEFKRLFWELKDFI